jgi:hypothetical protein
VTKGVGSAAVTTDYHCSVVIHGGRVSFSCLGFDQLDMYVICLQGVL